MTHGIIAAIRDVSDRRASADFLIDARTGERWTYASATELALRIAAGLRERGVSRGDRLGVLLENSPLTILTYFAALYAGVTIVPINRLGSEAEVDHALRAFGGGFVVTSGGFSPHARGTSIRLTAERGGICIDGESVSGLRPVEPFAGVDADDVFSITLTSGSTARPKGVVHSIATLFGNARSFNDFAGLGDETVFLHGLPMSYMAGFLNSIICPYMAGGAIVIGDEFSSRSVLDFWSVPRRHGVNTMWATPTLVAMLLELDRSASGIEHCREAAMRVFVGTAPLAPEHRIRAEERYGVPMRTSYGLSELLILTVRRPERGEDPDAVGAPLPDVELKVDQRGGSDDGEIAVRTPYASPGYFGDPGPKPEWFLTGDLGRLLDRGELRITGRKKDLIITGGTNVSPAAVEEVMRTHPAVRDVVAVAIPDPILGEVVGLAVEVDAHHDRAAIERELRSEYSPRLAHAQRPRHILVIEELPRSSTGKVRRADVRQLVSAAARSR